MISVRYFCEILMSTAAWLCHNVFTILFLKCSMTRELKNTWRLRLNNTGRQWVGESKEKIFYIAQQGSHTAVRWSTNQRAGSPFELFLPWAPWADSPKHTLGCCIQCAPRVVQSHACERPESFCSSSVQIWPLIFSQIGVILWSQQQQKILTRFRILFFSYLQTQCVGTTTSSYFKDFSYPGLCLFVCLFVWTLSRNCGIIVILSFECHDII